MEKLSIFRGQGRVSQDTCSSTKTFEWRTKKMLFRKIAEAVKEGDAQEVEQLIKEALAEGISASQLVNEALIVGMGEIGVLFKNNEVYVPEVLIAARAMHAGLGIVKPLLAAQEHAAVGKIVLGTVKGDLHDIGKNLVGMMFEGAGFEVIDIGIDVPPEKFIEAIKSESPGIVAMSALLTTTMPCMQEAIAAIEAAGLREQVKIIVGGAPVTDDFAEAIGADGFAPDAASAAELALELVS
jgi:5-methyltetrahydrofolate--homocysteine methyltransferase